MSFIEEEGDVVGTRRGGLNSRICRRTRSNAKESSPASLAASSGVLLLVHGGVLGRPKSLPGRGSFWGHASILVEVKSDDRAASCVITAPSVF